MSMSSARPIEARQAEHRRHPEDGDVTCPRLRRRPRFYVDAPPGPPSGPPEGDVGAHAPHLRSPSPRRIQLQTPSVPPFGRRPGVGGSSWTQWPPLPDSSRRSSAPTLLRPSKSSLPWRRAIPQILRTGTWRLLAHIQIGRATAWAVLFCAPCCHEQMLRAFPLSSSPPRSGMSRTTGGLVSRSSAKSPCPGEVRCSGRCGASHSHAKRQASNTPADADSDRTIFQTFRLV